MAAHLRDKGETEASLRMFEEISRETGDSSLGTSGRKYIRVIDRDYKKLLEGKARGKKKDK
jgi:hypothetical protein